ncbi:DUF3618 domain-containing protein [Mycobacterium asiaticum]|uniref:DUF3618 domain-containing protein n=1 Tax=Mycobacterium asiaticum TaxID=1790 RepID=A0A1A3NBF6_MYCAS|nr:DUF3618 domain-containing protein [Mycobacterium asiaticum]OBK19478.1 hypothetical protein A5636_19040 [Mycobacterium asiaticum]
MTGAEHTPPQPGSAVPEPKPDAGIEEIKADIEQTRAQLGSTVEALAAKADVPAQARAKAQAARPQLVRAASVAAVAMVALLWWRRRRRR